MAKANDKKKFKRAATPDAVRRQKAAIRQYYAEKAIKASTVSVPLKRHRDQNNGHYHIIMDSIDDKYVSVGTTSKPTKGKNSNSPNYRCEADILGNGEITYLRRQGVVDTQTNYFGSRSGYMTTKDFEQARTYANRAKQKYLDKKKK